MSELFLIAHKVRGEATFDIAERMQCPHCSEGCVECDALGYWWIIGTSGHRAYPYWNHELDDLSPEAMKGGFAAILPKMPPNWPDHYKHGPVPKINIKALFSATQPAKQHIARRL